MATAIDSSEFTQIFISINKNYLLERGDNMTLVLCSDGVLAIDAADLSMDFEGDYIESDCFNELV